MGLVYAKLFAGVLIVFLLGYRFLVRLPFSFDARILLESVKIAYPMTPRIFLGVIGTRFDQYMIGLLGSLGGVGIYNIGQKVAAMVFVYITSLENVFSPHVYKSMFEQKERGGKIIGSYLTAFAYISIFLALVVIVFSREIISLLTPPAYHNAADIIVILSLYYGFLFFEKITGMQLVYAKKTHITSVLVIATYALNIALNIPFIIRWGAFGAAWATLLTGLISGTVFFFVAQKYYLIVWEYRKIAVIFFLFIFSAFSILTLNAFYVWYPVQFAVKLLLITSYILLGLKLRLITKDNFLLVKNALLFKKFDAVPPADVAEVVAPEPGSLKP
ncbi:MAG: polysaccharide biosynthesis C-terminal domain-containing protein [Candidatus Omnitrophica bacterium]|nr:polysaccharide biosynthesis C-terminal domain-containing protein [Candidatus Omnitrophota bacterium]